MIDQKCRFGKNRNKLYDTYQQACNNENILCKEWRNPLKSVACRVWIPQNNLKIYIFCVLKIIGIVDLIQDKNNTEWIIKIVADFASDSHGK